VLVMMTAQDTIRRTVMEDQLITVVIAGIALVGILVKIVRDEVLRRHNPNLESLDGKLEGLKDQLQELGTTLSISRETAKHYRARSLELLTEIRDALKRDTP